MPFQEDVFEGEKRICGFIFNTVGITNFLCIVGEILEEHLVNAEDYSDIHLEDINRNNDVIKDLVFLLKDGGAFKGMYTVER